MTKIKQLRVEPQVALGEVIERNTKTIIDRWIRRVREEQPNAVRVHHDVLLNHMPDFLAHLGRCLGSAGDDSVLIRRQAEEHGDQRWDAGWSVIEVVRDYQILRVLLIEFFEETLGRPMRSREGLVLNVAIDDAIAASVSAFVASQTAPGLSANTTRTEAMNLLLNVLGGVGHEIRNPLAPLANSLEILRVTSGDAAIIENVRQMMDRQIKVLSRLVEDLMDLPRLARGKMSLRKERLDLSALLRTCVEDRRSSLTSAELELVVDVPHEPIFADGDSTRLSQVFGNLIGNAQKFTNRGGSIRVSLQPTSPARVTITVQDTGIGIEASVLPNVFEAYIQADQTHERSRGGLGLGLALVKGVVELHGGTVTAASEGLHKGSTFSIDLPLSTLTPNPAPAQSPNPTVASKPRRVLIIEDNHDSAESLRMYLQAFGHTGMVAHSGLEGIEAAERSPPEVVICDVGLPGMDGYAVAARLRQSVNPPPALIVAVTGYGPRNGSDGQPDRAFDYYLLKPVDPERIARLLSTIDESTLH